LFHETGTHPLLQVVLTLFMSRLFACLISNADRTTLAAVASKFAHTIEMLEDGVLFDVSGLERLIGKPESVAHKITTEVRRRNIPGKVAVADTAEAAMLLARSEVSLTPEDGIRKGPEIGGNARFPVSATALLNKPELRQPEMFSQLPLGDLDIEQDTLNVFEDLGLRKVEDLLAIPEDALVERYGREFQSVIRTIRQQGDRLIVPNIKEDRVSWSFTLDNAVEDFEQLIFILNHGLDDLLRRVESEGHSTDELDIDFGLANKTKRGYEIKTSFPTLEKAFWLKLINLRVSLDAPEAGILSLDVTARFTKPRPTQKGLYAAKRPEPESLLLTVNKLKKLVGEKEVGTPVLVDQRVFRPFALDADKIPDVANEQRLSRPICGEARLTDEKPPSSAASPPGGIAADGERPVTEKHSFSANRAAEPQALFRRPVIAFSIYRPAIKCEVLIRNDHPVFIRTRDFSGHILNTSGVWKSNSKWWDKPWKTKEWDIEVENYGIYRVCKVNGEWFLVGEYD
jgi:hypothetical protein